MNTDRNYVGKGDNATPNEPTATQNPQMAQDAAQTPPTADDRPNNNSQCVDVNQKVYKAQTELAALVDKFMDIGGSTQPVAVVNDLLYNWLTRPKTDLSLDANSNQLFAATQLVNFLTELSEVRASLNALKKAERTND